MLLCFRPWHCSAIPEAPVTFVTLQSLGRSSVLPLQLPKAQPSPDICSCTRASFVEWDPRGCMKDSSLPPPIPWHCIMHLKASAFEDLPPEESSFLNKGRGSQVLQRPPGCMEGGLQQFGSCRRISSLRKSTFSPLHLLPSDPPCTGSVLCGPGR